MGTSRESSEIKPLFRSIIKQLDDIEENTTSQINDETILKGAEESLTNLKMRLKNKLNSISIRNEKIILLLDSIDQLSNQDYGMEWIINNLPKNVKMIYTVLNNFEERIFERLKNRFGDDNCVEMGKLELCDGIEILQGFLETSNRQLTAKQWAVINILIQNTREILPLHIKLLFDITSKWTSSYEAPQHFSNCVSIKETIKYLFKNLEIRFGAILFRRCIFYLTLFDQRGISENELEDVLSIDDDVLTSVFKHHHAPVRRFPIALWLNIKYELKEYITNKETDGVSVISWLHKVFIEASNEYLESIENFNDSKDSVLMNVVDYFTEKWNKLKSNGERGEMKEFKYKKEKLHTFKVKNPGAEELTYLAFRNTKPQKIREEQWNGDKNVVKYNKRLLNELIAVIMMFKNNEKKIELLKKYVYFNYEFILSKAQLGELNFSVEMQQKIIDLGNQELIDISQLYVRHLPSIESLPYSLCWIISSRFKFETHYFKKLVESSGLSLVNRGLINTVDTINDVYNNYTFEYVQLLHIGR